MITKTKTKFAKDDIRLKMMVERRNLSDDIIKNYNTVFKEVYGLFNITL